MIDDIRWKFVAAVAIIAMAVSFLSGGLGGIRIGVLITRAVIGGFIFSVLAVGLNLFIARFFPEILEGGSTGQSEINRDEETPGSRVDILMPSEAPGMPGSVDDIEDVVVIPGPEEIATDVESIGDEGESAEGTSETVAENLDDLDRFSESFDESADESNDASAPVSEGPGGNHDPEELAQAIQTVIKRDEKG